MKKPIIILSVLAFISSGCIGQTQRQTSNSDMDTVMITMTLNKFGVVKINLKGSGTVIIDWGNDMIDNTQMPPSGVLALSRTYLSKSNRTITIHGQHITHLKCKGNQITSLDASNNSALKSLQCSKNQLMYLDVSKNTALTNLVCDRNQLTNLDVSKNTALTFLTCDKNQLTSIDVSKNIALTNLSCSGNQLKSLNVSKNTALTFLNCRKNQLSAEALDILFGALNSAIVEGKILYILNNPGTKTCNQKIASDRGWKIDTSLI